MTIFLTVLITLAVLSGLVALLIHISRDDIADQQAAYEAFLKTWQAERLEYDTEQRLRQATREAMGQMLDEARKHRQS